MESSVYVKAARILAVLSFLIGTFFLVLFWYTESMEIAETAEYYVILALLINSFVFVALLLKARNDQANSSELIGAALLLLVNIPVAIVYFIVFFNLAMKIFD